MPLLLALLLAIMPTNGITCDGKTDTTVAIQRELNGLQSGQALRLPAGTCVTSKSLMISGKNNVALIGAGKDSTIIKAINEASGSVRAYKSSNVRISGIQVFYPKTTKRWSAPEQDCFASQQSRYVTFDGVKGQGCAAAGILFVASSDGLVLDSIIDHSRADAFHAWASTRVTFQRNTGTGMGDDCLASIGGKTAGSESSYVNFYDNLCTGGNWGGGIHYDHSMNGEALRNRIDHVGLSCAAVSTDGLWSGAFTSNHILIADNIFEGCVTRTITGHPSIALYSANGSTTALGPDIRIVRNIVRKPTSGAGFKVWGKAKIVAAANDNSFCGMKRDFNIEANGTISRSGNTYEATC